MQYKIFLYSGLIFSVYIFYKTFKSINQSLSESAKLSSTSTPTPTPTNENKNNLVDPIYITFDTEPNDRIKIYESTCPKIYVDISTTHFSTFLIDLLSNYTDIEEIDYLMKNSEALISKIKSNCLLPNMVYSSICICNSYEVLLEILPKKEQEDFFVLNIIVLPSSDNSFLKHVITPTKSASKI